MDDLLWRFLNIRVYQEGGSPSLHKPLLLLYALGKLIRENQRLISFMEIDSALSILLDEFHPSGSNRSNTHYPFGKLENDGIWEVEQSTSLKRTAVGHLLKSEIIDKGIRGGFNIQVFDILVSDKEQARSIAQALAQKYFPGLECVRVLEAVGIKEIYLDHVADIVDAVSINQEYADRACAAKLNGGKDVRTYQNSFIGYLNTLHNLTASGANALAESQALNLYFGELYEPFALVSELKRILADGTERVVILTGHAGDGKSTVALDVFKSIQNLPPTQPLNTPMGERIDIPTAQGCVTIVKDMSELSGTDRQTWLTQAFEETGRWLIVSNTGPLLHSLIDYGESQGQNDIESRVLALLDAPLNEAALEQNVLNGFAKPLLILNLTRLDNVALGARILGKLIAHSGWTECAGCSIEEACPLALNRKALLETELTVMDRVRWIYRRISDYEQRLTLRQIVAQLAFGLTGGMGCAEAQARVEASTAVGADRGTKTLQEILFSESFFGYCAGIPDPQTERLQAIALLRRSMMGGPVSAAYERELLQDAGAGWAELPDALRQLAEFWRRTSTAKEAVPTRAALRRMWLVFGKPKSTRTDDANIFFDAMLRSPGLRELDDWQRAGKLRLSTTESKRLRTACLNVLLEAFSGFSASQFEARHDDLYLTLRRPDRAVVQPTQLIIGSLPFRDFDLEFDPVARLPKLIYRRAAVELLLTLPLLDYIHRRAAGELGNGLAPIHQAQLNRFQAELLQVDDIRDGRDGEIGFLRAGIDGDVQVYRYTLDEQAQRLERA